MSEPSLAAPRRPRIGTNVTRTRTFDLPPTRQSPGCCATSSAEGVVLPDHHQPSDDPLDVFRGIVSNNSGAAIRAFLGMHGMDQDVALVEGRDNFDLDLMKPSPCLVRAAVGRLDTVGARCVFVGDSASDVLAGDARGSPAHRLRPPARARSANSPTLAPERWPPLSATSARQSAQCHRPCDPRRIAGHGGRRIPTISRYAGGRPPRRESRHCGRLADGGSLPLRGPGYPPGRGLCDYRPRRDRCAAATVCLGR
jgi:hypothetical protein